MDVSNDNINEQSLVDDFLLHSLNETDANSHLIDYQEKNIHQQVDQLKSQRQIDEDEFPSAVTKFEKIAILRENKYNDLLTESQLQSNSNNMDDDLAKAETSNESQENEFFQQKTIDEQNNNLLTESNEDKNENNSFNKGPNGNQSVADESIYDEINELSNENENNFSSDESTVDKTNNNLIKYQPNSVNNSTVRDMDIEDDNYNNKELFSVELTGNEISTNTNDNSSSIENQTENDISFVQTKVDEISYFSIEAKQINEKENHFSSIDQTKNTSIEFGSNSTDIIEKNDISSNELMIEQAESISIKFQSNIINNHNLTDIENIDENDNSFVNSTVDEIKIISTKFEFNPIEDIHSTESRKENEDEIYLIEPTLHQTNNSSAELKLNLVENLHLIQSEKSNENETDLNDSIFDEKKNISTETEKVNEDNNQNNIHEVETTVKQMNDFLNESESNLIENSSATESDKENEVPNKNEEIKVSLNSCLLPDVVNQTLQENRNDFSNHKIEVENEFIEEANIKNENDLLEQSLQNLTKSLIDSGKTIDVKLDHIDEQEQKSSLLNSNLNSSEFEDILGNKSLLKQIKVNGELNSRPTRSTLATVSYKVSLIDNLTSNIQFIEKVSNERFFVSEFDIIPAIDICVQTMNRGESVLIDCDNRHGYGDSGCQEKLIPAVSSHNSYRMLIELELHDWTSPSDIRQLSIDERLFWGDKKKRMGNFHYRRQDYSTALHCYNGALRFLDTDMNPILISYNSSQQSLLNDQFIQVENNIAQVNLFLNKYDACLNSVENVLKHDPKNVKALFRKGKALFQLGQYDKAIQPLKLFMQIQKGDSNSDADKDKVNEMIQICENKLANYQKNEKEIYQRMFRPTSNLASNQQTQEKKKNKINSIANGWWPYIALGTAVLATTAIVTFIKHRKTT